MLGIMPAVATAALVPLAAGHDRQVAITMLAVSMAVFGFGNVVYNVAQVSFRQRLCPRPLLGRMNATVRFIVWGTIPIGAFLGAIIGGRYGAVTALWVGGRRTGTRGLAGAVEPAAADAGAARGTRPARLRSVGRSGRIR